MKNRILFAVNLLLSLMLLGYFIPFTINDFLNVGNSYGWLICYSCPFSAAALLAVALLGLRQDITPKLLWIPLAINTVTIISLAGLFAFHRANPDIGFLQRQSAYQAVAERIIKGEILIDEDGFAALPDELANTSLSGYVYVYQEPVGVTNIFFLDDAETFDGYSWGYLYRSDGSEPPADNQQNGRNCPVWREITPPTQKWFFCEAHRIYGFPGIYGDPGK